MHHVSVAGVVLDQPSGDVLLVRRRDNGAWQIPGGLLEPEEDPQVGLVREIEEETGLVISPTRLAGIYKNIRLHSLALVFACRTVGGEVAASTDETIDVGWYPRSQAVAMCDHMFGVRIIDALNGGTEPVIRTHDGKRILSTMFETEHPA